MTWHLRERVLSCGCRRREHSASKIIPILVSHTTQPRKVLQIDLMRIRVSSLTNFEYLLLGVHKASKFPFAFPLPSKQAERVAREPLQLCLTFIVPNAIRCDRDKELGAIISQHLYRWLKAVVRLLGPAHHLLAQETVEARCLDAGCTVGIVFHLAGALY